MSVFLVDIKKKLEQVSQIPHSVDLGFDCCHGKHACLLMLALKVEHIKCKKFHEPCGSHHIPGTDGVCCSPNSFLKGHSSWFSFENAIVLFLNQLDLFSSHKFLAVF